MLSGSVYRFLLCTRTTFSDICSINLVDHPPKSDRYTLKRYCMLLVSVSTFHSSLPFICLLCADFMAVLILFLPTSPAKKSHAVYSSVVYGQYCRFLHFMSYWPRARFRFSILFALLCSLLSTMVVANLGQLYEARRDESIAVP